MDQMQNNLVKIVENIEQQNIRLVDLTLNANDSIGGVFIDKMITNNLKVEIKDISSGTIIANSKLKMPTINCKYKFFLEQFLNEADDEKTKIIKIEAIYLLQIVLNTKIEELLSELQRDEIGETLSTFFNTTGKLMVYPYFRHLADILTRESGFTLPPLKPLKI